MWIMCFINKGSTGQSMLYSAEHDVVNNQYRRKNNLHTYTALLNTYYAPTPTPCIKRAIQETDNHAVRRRTDCWHERHIKWLFSEICLLFWCNYKYICAIVFGLTCSVGLLAATVWNLKIAPESHHARQRVDFTQKKSVDFISALEYDVYISVYWPSESSNLDLNHIVMKSRGNKRDANRFISILLN